MVQDEEFLKICKIFSLLLDIFQGPRGHEELANMAHWKITTQITLFTITKVVPIKLMKAGSKANSQEIASESHLLNLEIWL